MRYVDRYSYLLFRITPFGGKPFEKFSESEYISGTYVYRLDNDRRPVIKSAIGTITAIHSNTVSIKYHKSSADIILDPAVVIWVSIPDAEKFNVRKEILGNISMLEIGDSLQTGYLIDGRFDKILLYKKFYDRKIYGN